MAESQHGVRFRVNISTSTKGYHTWDAKIEVHLEGLVVDEYLQSEDVRSGTRTMILAESDALVAALEARYPNGERQVPAAETIPVTPVDEGGEHPAFEPSHTKSAHPTEMCLCFPLHIRPTLCETCGACACGECKDLGNPLHLRSCALYPEAEA
tara:strand:+ start:455 stop:916 length:462 start_codon:yes stop_codon:yes gene_type:complete